MNSPFIDEPNRVLRPDATPLDVAAWMILQSPYEWAHDPAAVVGAASHAAIDYANLHRLDDARFWTRVACALEATADNPNVYVGAVCGALADTFGVAHR